MDAKENQANEKPSLLGRENTHQLAGFVSGVTRLTTGVVSAGAQCAHAKITGRTKESIEAEGKTPFYTYFDNFVQGTIDFRNQCWSVDAQDPAYKKGFKQGVVTTLATPVVAGSLFAFAGANTVLEKVDAVFSPETESSPEAVVVEPAETPAGVHVVQPESL